MTACGGVAHIVAGWDLALVTSDRRADMVEEEKSEGTQVQIRIVVRAIWDDEAEVWVATSEDVPGLVTESASLDDLMRRCEELVPELLDLNNAWPADPGQFAPVELIAQRNRPNYLNG